MQYSARSSHFFLTLTDNSNVLFLVFRTVFTQGEGTSAGNHVTTTAFSTEFPTADVVQNLFEKKLGGMHFIIFWTVLNLIHEATTRVIVILP